MNHFEAHLMVSSREVLSKAIYSKHFDEKKIKMANVMLEILDIFFFGMSSHVRAFKLLVFATAFEFWIVVNEY